jgi:nucleoside phosphorylase
VTELSPAMRHVLATLSDTLEPLSGRRIAALTGISPTTANKALVALLELGVVGQAHHGRAVLWQTTAAAERMLNGQGERAERTVVMLTALPEEYVAVRQRLAKGEERRARRGERYLKAAVSGVSIRWTAYVFEAGMGNASAASVIGPAVEEFDADLVVFVGIAGGLKPADHVPGDVIIADRVYNGHSGKFATDQDGQSVFQSRPKGRDTAYPLVQLARQLARTPGRGPAGAGRRPRITIGSIASTEAVVADQDSQIFQHIRNELNDCCAVDMETFGAYEAAHASRIPIVAVRGISDFVEGKTASTDARWQPVAARNAADVTADLLAYADPDDVPPRRLSPVSGPERESDAVSPRSLLPNARVWARRLGAASARCADAAAGELGSSSVMPLATWVSRTLNRPPDWLRADRTGDGWALVGALADTAEASTAPRAYTLAAQKAEQNGDSVLAAVHRLSAALSAGRPGEDDVAHAEAIRGALEAADLSACPWLRPLADFHIATTRNDTRAVLSAAAPAVTCLGYDPAAVGLGSAYLPEHDGSTVRPGTEHSTAPMVPPLPDEVRKLLTAGVLVTASVAWLFQDDGEPAQRAAEAALALMPGLPAAQLRRSQAVLTRLHDRSRAPELEDTRLLLRSIEETALAVRRARQQWGGATGEALALAGRARLEAGDPVGALRLLRPAPHGQATASEAKTAEVRQFAAIAALIAGDNELALELAAVLPGGVEAQLVRGSAFARSPGMHEEARYSYWHALELAGDDPRYLQRALLGLARLGSPLDGEGPDGLGPRIQRLREQDPQAADLVLGNAALKAGDYARALSLARRYRTDFQAVELEAYALMESGDATAAVGRLDRFGQDRGDDSVRAQAMMLARRAGLYENVCTIADAIISSQVGELRRVAREAKAEAAGRMLAWEEVDTQARLLAAELDRSDPQEAAARETDYRWIRAEALYHRRKFSLALKELSEPAPLSASKREQVLLVLATTQALAAESPQDLPQSAFDWILAISAAWVGDEQISTEAAKLILMMPVAATDVRLTRARALLEDYFTTHDNVPGMKKIVLPPDPDTPGGYDLTPLVEELRSQFEPQAAALGKLTTELWLGRLPAAFLAEATNRTYAESLIRQPLGCYPIRQEPPQDDGKRLAATREALREGRVVADTSALIIGSKLGVPRTHLTGLFRQVILPALLRDDIYGARAVLAHHSDMTMGWDPAAGGLTLTRYDPDTVDTWFREADALQHDLASLSVQADAPDAEHRTWRAALLLAKALSVPLWADDIALRALADSEAVPAFGTLDLLGAAEETGRLEAPPRKQLNAALVAARAVDLPLPAPWPLCAQKDAWDPAGYTALSISRPAAWADQAASFRQYRNLIRGLIAQYPEADPTDCVAGWAAAAASGVAWATPPGGRPKAVGALLAWTALNAEPMLDARTIQSHMTGRRPAESERPPHVGKVLGALLSVAASLQSRAFPDGDGIHHVVTILADAIRTTADGITTAAIVARALSMLSEEYRARAMTALLASPAAARPEANKPRRAR